jgi:hypothetical protein
MKSHRWPGHVLAGLGLALGALAGCQTWVPTTGQTLPSGRYLQHPPQYLPPSPPFPLPRELAQQERAAAAVPELAAPAIEPPPPAVPPAGAAAPGGEVAPAPLPPPPP